jgi:hypothetical protein
VIDPLQSAGIKPAHCLLMPPKPTPMITLTNDEVGWIPVLRRQACQRRSSAVSGRYFRPALYPRWAVQRLTAPIEKSQSGRRCAWHRGSLTVAGMIRTAPDPTGTARSILTYWKTGDGVF